MPKDSENLTQAFPCSFLEFEECQSWPSGTNGPNQKDFLGTKSSLFHLILFPQLYDISNIDGLKQAIFFHIQDIKDFPSSDISEMLSLYLTGFLHLGLIWWSVFEGSGTHAKSSTQ